MKKTATCDQCKRRFTINMKTERISGGGEQWSFACPFCAHCYEVCRITRRGIELRRQLDSIKAQLRLAPHNEDLAVQREALLVALEAEITDLTTPHLPESPSSSTPDPLQTETA